MHSVFVCSVCCGFQQGSVLLTLVTQRMTFHVCLQCLKCSGQFNKGRMSSNWSVYVLCFMSVLQCLKCSGQFNKGQSPSNWSLCIVFHVCLQCLKCSSQFTKGQAHTVIHREDIAHTGSSKDFKSMADTGGEDINDKGTG